jgi:hypothetical protein
MKLQGFCLAFVYLAFACGAVFPQEKDEDIQTRSFLTDAWKRVFTEESTEVDRATRYCGIVEGHFKVATPKWWRLCIAADDEWSKSAPNGEPDFPKWFRSDYRFSKYQTSFCSADHVILVAEAFPIEAAVRITCFEDNRGLSISKWAKEIEIHPGVSNGPSHHRCEIFTAGRRFIIFGGHFPLFYLLIGDQQNGDVSMHIVHSFLSDADHLKRPSAQAK